MVADFLIALDGAVGDRAGVIVVGATNRLHAISPAILRNGRLERAVYLGPPSANGASRILRHHLGPALPDADLGEVSAICASRSMTGADIMDLVRSARRRARRAAREISLEDLKSILIPDRERPPDLARRIAVHESGHALLAALHMPTSLTMVTIEPGGADINSGGHTQLTTPDNQLETAVELENRVEMLLAGRAAEILIFGSPSSGSGGSSSSDLALAVRTLAVAYLTLGLFPGGPRWRCEPGEVMFHLMRDPIACHAVEARLATLADRALETLGANRASLNMLSDTLLTRKTVHREEILAMIGSQHQVETPYSPAQQHPQNGP